MSAKIIIISGAAGTGKTTTSAILAQNSCAPLTVHLHTDDFYEYIRKGYIAPWLNESGDQNETVVDAIAASAEKFVLGGYEVYVDGVIGPWFLEPWRKLAGKGIDVRYVVLRPGEQVTVERALKREQQEYFPLDDKIVAGLCQMFSDLGEYEAHAVDTGGQTVQESAEWIRKRLKEGGFRIG